MPATYVLIHGAGDVGWYWHLVEAELRGRDHDVEWSHNPLPWMTEKARAVPPACYCGKHGCVETFLSGPGFERDYALSAGARRQSPNERAWGFEWGAAWLWG